MSRKYLSGAARAEAAVKIAALAAKGFSDPQTGRELGLTEDQVRRVREQFDISPGQPVRDGRPGHVQAKRKTVTVDCPLCGATGLRLWVGRVKVHNEWRVRLVPSVDGPRPEPYESFKRCAQSGQPLPTDIDEAAEPGGRKEDTNHG